MSSSVAFFSEASVAFVVPDAFPSFKPFSNSLFAEPKFFANLGIAAPPKMSTATTMTTIKRSGPKISPKNTVFSFDVRNANSSALGQGPDCAIEAAHQARQE